MSIKHDIVKPKCAPGTFAQINHLLSLGQDVQAYKDSLTCNYNPNAVDPMGYVGTWGSDRGKLFPFEDGYTNPGNNITGTCDIELTPIDAKTWNNLPLNSSNIKMTKKSFCNLATVGETPLVPGGPADKPNLALFSKELMDTAKVIYKKIQDMESETNIYYNQSTIQNNALLKQINMYKIFYNRLIAVYNKNSQPDITLEGQADDAQLKATSGYYEYFIWSILAALIFSFTMFRIRR